jgi:hypothetical protein
MTLLRCTICHTFFNSVVSFILGYSASNNMWIKKAIKHHAYFILQMSQKDFLSPEVLSLRTFCPARHFVHRTFCPAGCFVPPDVLSRRMFCPAGRFVPPDVLSRRTFCPYGHSVPRMSRLLCRQMFCLWTFCPYERFVLMDVLSPNILSGHRKFNI